MFGTSTSAAEPAEVIRELRKNHQDKAAYRAALLAKLNAKEEDPRLRLAALNAVGGLNSLECAWGKAAGFYRALLSSQDTPAGWLPACAEGLARAARQGKPLKDAARDLEQAKAGLPQQAATALDPHVQALGQAYAPKLRPGNVTFPEPAVPPVTDSKLFQPFLACVDAALAQGMLAEGEARARARDWAAARRKYADLLGIAPDGEKAALAALEGLLKTFVSESDQEKLSAHAAQLFMGFLEERKTPAAILESARLHVAQAFFKDNAYDHALKQIAMLREKFPNGAKRFSADLLDGLIHSRQGQNEHALQVFRKVAGEAKADSEIRQKAQFLIGWTHLFDQNQGAAREAFEALVKEFPDGELAKKAKELLLQIPKANEP